MNRTEKNKILQEKIKNFKMKNVGTKRMPIVSTGVIKQNSIVYPGFNLKAQQAPELTKYNVNDRVMMLIEGVIVGHYKNERKDNDINENFDIEIRKLGVKPK